MVASNRFREDLYYRINAIQLEIPPLRDRKEDIPVLARFFLRKYSLQYEKPELKLTDKSLKRLRDHHWPGNIRELEHAVEKAVILSEERTISAEHLFVRSQPVNPDQMPVSLNLEAQEKQIIARAMRQEKGNISSAAKKLGINRSTLYMKLKKYGI